MTERVATARPGAWLKPGTLPFGWAEATIGDLIGSDGIFRDGDWVETKDQDPEGDVRLTQLADIGVGFFRDRSSRFLTSEAAACLGCTFLEPGDVLIARMPDPLGRACLFPGDSRRCVTAVDVCIVRPGSTGVDPRWLMWWINTPEFRGDISALQAGTTRKRISRKNLATIEFPLPPLNEQRRIVAAIEEHLSRLDAADASLVHATRRLDALKRRSRASLDEVDAPAFRLGQLLDGALLFSDGDWVESKDQDPDGDVRLIQLADVGDGEFRDRSRRFLTSDTVVRLRCTYLEAGDVLVARMPDPLGRACIFPGVDQPSVTAVDVCIIRPGDEIEPAWLMHALNAPGARREIQQLQSGTTRKRISRRNLAKIMLRMPPLEEQRRIVAEIEERLGAIDALRAAIERAQRRGAALRRLILERAFRGELVPQDPSDEPASALLDRIRADRDA